MPIHKLSDGPISMTVRSVENTVGKFGPQWKFDGDECAVYVSETAVASQITDRMKITPEETVGMTLTFAQVKKDGKTYTNITKGANAATATHATSTTASTPASRKTLDERTAFYSKCVEAAIVTLGAKCEAAGIPLDARAIQAAAYTLYAGGIE